MKYRFAAAAAFLIAVSAAAATTLVGSLPQPAGYAAATLLLDGRVFVAGGSSPQSLSAAEIYDPATGTFTPTHEPMNVPHGNPQAILLHDGRVLVTCGVNGPAPATAEVYDPASDTFTVTATPASRHLHAPLVMLPDGRVLVAGGSDELGNATSLVEVFDPATNSWSQAGNLAFPRYFHAAALLRDGRLLVIGGQDAGGGQNSEIFDPRTGTSVVLPHTLFSQPIAVTLQDGRVAVMETVSMYVFDEKAQEFELLRTGIQTSGQSAALLHDGSILLAGGQDAYKGGASNQIFIANIEDGSAIPVDTLQVPRSTGPAVVLKDGSVLIIGGLGTDLKPLDSVERYSGTPRRHAIR